MSIPRDVVLYAVVEILVKLFAIITLPIVSRNLSVEDFGLARLFLDVSTLYVTISTLGMIPACLNASKIGDVKVTYAKSIWVAYQAFLIILIPFSLYLSSLGYSTISIVGILIYAKISIYVGYARSYLVLNGYKKTYAQYMLLQVMLLFGLIFGVDHLDLLSLTSYIFISAFAALPVYFFVSFNLKNSIKHKLGVDFLRFSRSSFISSIFQFMSASGDKLLLVKVLEPTFFGLFGVLALLASVLRVAANSLTFSIQPYYYLHHSSQVLKTYLFWLNFFIPVGLVSFNYIGIYGLEMLLDESYVEVLKYIPAYTIGVLFEVWGNFLSQALIKAGQSMKILISDILLFFGKIISIFYFYYSQDFLLLLMGYSLSSMSRLIFIRFYVKTDEVFYFPFKFFALITIIVFYLGFYHEYI